MRLRVLSGVLPPALASRPEWVSAADASAGSSVPFPRIGARPAAALLQRRGHCLPRLPSGFCRAGALCFCPVLVRHLLGYHLRFLLRTASRVSGSLSVGLWEWRASCPSRRYWRLGVAQGVTLVSASAGTSEPGVLWRVFLGQLSYFSAVIMRLSCFSVS